MQQLWYTIKKVKDLESYEFLLANKKCILDAEVFKMILDICLRVKGEEFTKVYDDDDATLTFLIDFGYKGPLHKYTNMYVDHIHQPCRTIAAIINKCLSGKTTSNELNWEDFSFQIDHKNRRKSRRETIPLPYSPKSSSITSSYNTSLSPSYNFNTIIQSRMMIPPRRANAKVHKERRLLLSLRNQLMYLKSLNLNLLRKTGVRDEFTVIPTTSSEGTVNEDKDEEMKNAKVKDFIKGDAEISNVAKEDTERIEEIKDDAKKANLPPISSSLSVSSSFENDLSELKKIDLSAEALATLKSQVPTVVDNYLGSKHGDALQKFKKSASEIRKIKREQATKQKMPKYTIKSTDKGALKYYDLKSALYQTMHENKYFNRIFTNHALCHALMKALIENENAMDKGVVDTVKNHKRQHDDDDDEDPSTGPYQGKKTKRRRIKKSKSSKKPSTTKETPKGKASSKGSKTGKSASIKEPVKEPIAEVEWMMQSTLQVKMWFVVMINHKTLQNLRHTRLQIKIGSNNLQGLLLLIRNGTSIKLYLINLNNLDKLNWNNPEGDHYPFDLSKPLPLQGRPGHLTVVVDYFFNNDLEYLKTFDPEKIVKKLHGYVHLEEIVVKRADQQQQKFKDGNIVNLHLNNIEDMLLLAVW
nr:hypothetical protein [Tanacetum cinerariifolium]